MSVIKRALIAAIVVALVLSAAVGCAGPAAETQEAGSTDTHKIGAVLSLTGTYAALGASAKDAIDLEVGRINAAGGVNGRQLEVIIEDDGTDEAKAVAAATKLIDQDGVVAIIGASGTGQSMAMRSEIQRAGVSQVSLAGGSAIMASFEPLVFQTPWPNALVVPFVLDAMKARGATRVALISDTGGYGKDGRDVILGAVGPAGIEIVSDQTFNPGDTDMSAQLTKIKGDDADALLIWNAGKEAAIIVNSASELGIDLPMFGGSGQARLEFIEGGGEAAEGFIFGTGKSLVPENWPEGSEQRDAMTDFASRYEQTYGEPPDIFAGHAYDAIVILEDALRRAGENPGPTEVREAIEGTSGLPGFGGTFSFSATDHNGLTADDLALYEVRSGAWVAVE